MADILCESHQFHVGLLTLSLSWALLQSCTIFSCNPWLQIWPQACIFYSASKLWLPDAVWQRPESHPHEQLRLQLGDHRGFRGHWWDGAATFFLSLVLTTEISSSLSPFDLKQMPFFPQSPLFPQSGCGSGKRLHGHLNAAPVCRTQKHSECEESESVCIFKQTNFFISPAVHFTLTPNPLIFPERW